MSIQKIYPIKNHSYTFKEIERLYLRDNPSLCFTHENIKGCIQTSHLLSSDLMSVHGMAESRWIYIKETFDWIPIFQFDVDVDQPHITSLVDIELYDDNHCIYYNGFWWATPKGFPRKQHE